MMPRSLRSTDRCLHPQFEADLAHAVRVFHREVLLDQLAALGGERGRAVGVEPQTDVVGVVGELVQRRGEIVVQGLGRAGPRGRTNSSSNARWTIVPLVVATPGASGSRWMLENRNCMGQTVKDDTRDGDSDVGTA